MSISFVVRKYRSGDRESCRDLWRELTEWHREIYQDPTIGGENPEDHFDEHLEEVGPHQIWVAVHNSQVIGLVGLIVEEKEGEIEPIIIKRGFRKKGIGRQLIEGIISEVRSRGIRFLKVKPVARNIRAMKFFYERGFKNLGHIEMFMDLSDSKRRPWKVGPEISGCRFCF
ncbi:MAG: GNAT family N-acetyltransferase [Promethearchaeota archaeon]